MADTIITFKEIPWRDTDVKIFPLASVQSQMSQGLAPSSNSPVHTVAVTSQGSIDALVAATAASLTVGTGNAGLVFTAQTGGTAGNSITVRFVDPAGNDQALSVGVVGSAITVNLATGPAGAITSTATLIKAAIEASGPAAALVAVTLVGNGSGVVTAHAVANLAGGEAVLSPGDYAAYGPVTVPAPTGYPNDDGSGTRTKHYYRQFHVA